MHSGRVGKRAACGDAFCVSRVRGAVTWPTPMRTCTGDPERTIQVACDLLAPVSVHRRQQQRRRRPARHKLVLGVDLDVEGEQGGRADAEHIEECAAQMRGAGEACREGSLGE